MSRAPLHDAPSRLFECVPNVSEGRNGATLDACARAIVRAGATLADRTSDAAHHRSVFTFFGTRERVLAAALGLARVAAEIDLRAHDGAHPRIGALDVLPFIPFGSATMPEAIDLAGEAARRIWHELGIPAYLYGEAASTPERRLLANVRRGGFEGLATRTDLPDVGDVRAHPSAGAIAIGARRVLVAFNVILASDDLALAQRIAAAVRERGGGLRTLRALGIRQSDGRVQISCNVTDWDATPLQRVAALVGALAEPYGVALAGSELIGLVPRAALENVVAQAFGTVGRPPQAPRNGRECRR